ncbi:MAG: methyl-accepting chemotaxis protein [Synergistaceae bacterium]|nr:methyl-accepting chemotaxis protein [Synergistaceae bacterium]
MKLILSFSVIVAINICFGLYALYLLAVINGRVVEANSWTEGIMELGNMQYGVTSLRRYDLNYVQQTEKNQKLTTLQHRTKATDAVEAVMKDYRDDVLTIPYDTEEQRKEDLAAIDLIISNWNVYLDISQKLLDASDAGNEDEVMEILNGDSLVKFTDLEASVNALVDFNTEGCLAVMLQSEEIYQSAKRTTAVTLLFIAGFSVIIPIFLVRRIKKSIKELLRVSEAVGRGVLTVSAEDFVNDEFGKLAAEYNNTIANFKSLVSKMQESAAYMAGAAREFHEGESRSSAGTQMIAQNIGQVSRQADSQRTEIESITVSANGMVDDIANISEKLDTIAQGAAESVRISNEGGKFMREAISQMKVIETAVNASSEVVSSLGKRSNEIGLIVGTIADISSQTNLLALNAAIEAARAGDQGRGFAVVAEEVKKLASESQTAAEEISNLISSIQQETAHAVEAMATGKEDARVGALAMDEGGRAFDELAKMAVQSSDGLTGIAALMREMSTKTSEIASAVNKVEDASREIAHDSQSIAAATEEQSAYASKVSNSSQELAGIASDMLELTRHFTTVSTAG